MEKRLTWKIIWKEEENKSIVIAFNQKDEQLGWLSYEKVGAHMHWCWYQYTNIRMSPGCLQEVRDKQKELFNEGKRKYRTG